MAPLHFPKIDLNKLCHSVQNEATLICAKFGADLVTVSKATGSKTKWPRFLAYSVVLWGLDRGWQWSMIWLLLEVNFYC